MLFYDVVCVSAAKISRIPFFSGSKCPTTETGSVIHDIGRMRRYVISLAIAAGNGRNRIGSFRMTETTRNRTCSFPTDGNVTETDAPVCRRRKCSETDALFSRCRKPSVSPVFICFRVTHRKTETGDFMPWLLTRGTSKYKFKVCSIV